MTHTVLPEDIVATHDARLEQVEAALAAGRPTAGASAAGQPGDAGVRRVRRWLRGLDSRAHDVVVALLPGVDGDLLARVRATFGDRAGALVGLRRWLWERHGPADELQTLCATDVAPPPPSLARRVQAILE